MSLLDLIRRPQPASDELERRAADIQAQEDALNAQLVVRQRLKATAQQAAEAHHAAHVRLTRLLVDPDTVVTAADGDLEAAKDSKRATAEAARRAESELSAHIEQHGDLDARIQTLRCDRESLEKQRILEADRADAAEFVRLGSALAAIHERLEQRRHDAAQRWPGLGLPDLTFPPGIFGRVNRGAGVGELGVWTDHVLPAIALAYPDLFPAADAADILDRAKRKVQWRANGVTWHAAPFRGPIIADLR